MCLYPKLIKNKKYLPTKKNKYNPPTCTDERLRYVTSACGRCYECRSQKRKEWLVRLSEDIRENNNVVFVTLTINDESWEKISKKYGLHTEEDCIKKMIRLFLERIRKATKKSIKHWLVTERGQDKTERYHLHGLIWDDGKGYLTREYWKYGFVFIGQYVNEETINYVTKYMLKKDEKHEDFISTVLCSKGIGSGYLKRADAETNKFNEEKTKELYTTRTGLKLNLPKYYRNKIYTEKQREKLWIQKIEKGDIYVMGEKVKADDWESYNALLRYHRERCVRLHGDDEMKWEEEKYKRMLKRQRANSNKK